MFNIILNLWPNHFHGCLIVEGFLASENWRAADSQFMGFLCKPISCFPSSPRKGTNLPHLAPNWNLTVHCWQEESQEISRAHIGGHKGPHSRRTHWWKSSRLRIQKNESLLSKPFCIFFPQNGGFCNCSYSVLPWPLEGWVPNLSSSDLTGTCLHLQP